VILDLNSKENIMHQERHTGSFRDNLEGVDKGGRLCVSNVLNSIATMFQSMTCCSFDADQRQEPFEGKLSRTFRAEDLRTQQGSLFGEFEDKYQFETIQLAEESELEISEPLTRVEDKTSHSGVGERRRKRLQAEIQKGKRSEGLLLSLDYSGMSTDGRVALREDELLQFMEASNLNSLRSQVAAAVSLEGVVFVMDRFHGTLNSIQLPRPASVDAAQALKDASREFLRVNGANFKNNPTGACSRIKRLLRPLVYEKALVETIVKDVLRASSRTAWGGDAYAVVNSLLGQGIRPLTPESSPTVDPIEIQIVRASGVVTIKCKCVFLLHRDVEALDGIANSPRTQSPVSPTLGEDEQRGESADETASASLTRTTDSSPPESRKWFSFSDRRNKKKHQANLGGQTSGPLRLSIRVKVTLGVFDGSCTRVLSINHDGYSYSWLPG
jgi:hypothetical protein